MTVGKQQTKRCTKCGETKPLDAFSPEQRVSDGLSSRCKVCRNQYHRERRANDPEWREMQNTCIRENKRKRAWLRRAFVLAIASDGAMRCAKCGCDDVMELEVDHVAENGYEHREACGAKGRGIGSKTVQCRYYGSMLDSACDGLQVLCKSCNTAKSNRNRKTKGVNRD